MRVKLILAAFLTLGIIGLLFFTQQGKAFLNFFRQNIQPTFSSLLAFFTLQKPSESYFFFSLELNRSFLSGSFEAVNSTFLTKGKLVILVNGVPLSIPKNSVLRIEDCQGKFDINEKVKASLNAKKVYVDEIVYGPSEFKIEFETSLKKALISGVKKDLINFSGISGKLEQLAEDGSIKQSVKLENDELKINNFFGLAKLGQDLAYLQGYATKIKGKNFEWFG